MSLFMNKNDATLLIKSNLNRHVLIFLTEKLIFGLKIVVFSPKIFLFNFCPRNVFCVSTIIATSKNRTILSSNAVLERY